MEDVKAKVVDLDLNDILPNRFQPRIKFSEESIIELSESIKEHGVIQPIIVRPIGDKYEIIAGERRYKASVLAGKDTIPAIISSLNDKDCAEVALIENVQRRDLSAIEEAVSYKKILDMGYLTQEQLAVKLGKSQSAVANKIRLLNLCDEVQEALMEEQISERHARALLKIHEASKQKEMLDRIIKERLTVRKTEEEIEEMNNYIMEPNNESNMNNNPSGFSTVNPGFMSNDIPQTQTNDFSNNKPVDFSALLMNEAAKANSTPAPTPSVEPAPVAPQGGYQFDASGRVVGEPAPMPSVEPAPVAPQGGYQFDASGRVVGEPTPMPSVEPVPVAPQGGYQFDASGRVVGEPNSMPSIEPAPSMPQGGYQFDASGRVVGEPNPMPSMGVSEMPQTPIVESTTIATDSMMSASETNNSFNFVSNMEPVMKEDTPKEEKALSFNDLLATNSQREAQAMATYFEPVAPSNSPEATPTFIDPMMPQTPILNSQLPDTFLESTTDSSEEDGTSGGFNSSMPAEPRDSATGDSLKEEKVDIQPIIITDYSKQYDPVLPQSQQPVERIDFKQIISLIRDVNDTIEKCGYTVETEEVDLENEYQVVFRINKN